MLWQGPPPVSVRLALRVAVLALAALALLAPAATAAPAPPGSTWSQHYIDEADGTQLHADVLRPANLPADAKTPVILSIGPYFNHSGQTGPAGPVENTPFDPITADGPSDRFYDFINGAKVFDKGYTWVQVDLRGFGGSDGCLDWGGPGEQADVTAAVEWAAKQSWSTGKVGMYGKSYDGVTGLMGLVNEPKGLSAVVSQEPVYDLYRYLYMNRVRFPNSLLTPALYDAIAGAPGPLLGNGDPNAAPDILAYNFNSLNDTARPGCPAQNYADQQDPNHDSAYWKQRDLIAKAKGKRTPLFLTQGFIENNTKPDGAYDFFNNVAGPKRAWFGMWDHVRGNDTDDAGRLLMGRHGWFDETMRFYDQYLKGVANATAADPPIAVESSDGKWRSEAAWPPADSLPQTSALNKGTYTDDSTNNGTAEFGPPFGAGVWTFSKPFPYRVHLAGVPKISLDVSAPVPNANLVADVYDVDADNNATLISRGAYLLPGDAKIAFDMYGDDWTMPAGHRIGVLVTGANADWWQHVPTGQDVTVNGGKITLSYLGCRRDQAIEGGQSVKLEDYLKNAPFAIDAATVKAGTSPGFALPADQGGCTAQEIAAGGPSGTPGSGSGGGGTSGAQGCVDRRKFTFRLRHGRGQRVVRARAYVNGRLTVKKRGRNLRRLTLKKLPLGKFRVKILTRTNKGRTTRTVRTYKGCRKTRPHGSHGTVPAARG
jgi:putative CocE/NonD family hydrolase